MCSVVRQQQNVCWNMLAETEFNQIYIEKVEFFKPGTEFFKPGTEVQTCSWILHEIC